MKYNGFNLTNYELKAEISLQKGSSVSFIARSNDDIAYRVVFSATSIVGQMWDYKQKKVKKTFEKVDVDTKAFQKILVQSKGKLLRVTVNEKDVLIDYNEVPVDTTGFYLTTYTGKGAIKNVTVRAIY